MSSMPECRKCGDYIHHGPVLCERCDFQDEIESEHARICRAIGHYAFHHPFDMKSAKEIQSDLLAICGAPHVHVASIGSDACALCGHDLRHDVHQRDRTSPTNGEG